MTAKRGGLGKGLDSLIKENKTAKHTAPVKKEVVNAGPIMMKINDVEPNRDQPRKHFEEDALLELADSIKQFGILQPLIVQKRNDYYEIIAGERRWRAAKQAGIKEIPVIIKEYTDQEIVEISLIENIQRENLNPIEEAKGYRQLIKASGMTQEALSKAVSKSRSAITNSLRLLDLPEAVQQMMYEGKLTAGHARAILAVPFEDARIKLAEKVVAEGLSVRATETLAPLFSVGDTPRTPRPVTPQSYKKAARVLRQVFNTNVKVRSTRGKNKIEIEFKDEDDLQRILASMVESE